MIDTVKYKTLDSLINHEWTTDVTVETNEFGVAHFSGFYGTYGVTISTNRINSEIRTTLNKSCSNIQKINI